MKIFQKEEKKHSLGVCIPDSGKPMKEPEEEEAFAAKGFCVTGVFHVLDSLMVQGKVTGGTIRKKDRVLIGGKKLAVKDIQADGKSADSLGEGQKGALFLGVGKGKVPLIKAGDLLEF